MGRGIARNSCAAFLDLVLTDCACYPVIPLQKRGHAIVNGSAAQGLARPGHESIAVLRKAWHTVDEDYSGYLDRGEVGELIGLLLGHPISHHGAARALKKMDEVGLLALSLSLSLSLSRRWMR